MGLSDGLKIWMYEVMSYADEWAAMDPPQFVMPDVKDAVCFTVTEASEMLEVVLRMGPGYVRNNPDKYKDRDMAGALAVECVDTIRMALITLYLLGADPDKVLAEKLFQMDTKRRGIVGLMPSKESAE